MGAVAVVVDAELPTSASAELATTESSAGAACASIAAGAEVVTASTVPESAPSAEFEIADGIASSAARETAATKLAIATPRPTLMTSAPLAPEKTIVPEAPADDARITVAALSSSSEMAPSFDVPANAITTLLPTSIEPLTLAWVPPMTSVALTPVAEALNATSIHPPAAKLASAGAAASKPAVRSTPTAAPTSSSGA